MRYGLSEHTVARSLAGAQIRKAALPLSMDRTPPTGDYVGTYESQAWGARSTFINSDFKSGYNRAKMSRPILSASTKGPHKSKVRKNVLGRSTHCEQRILNAMAKRHYRAPDAHKLDARCSGRSDLRMRNYGAASLILSIVLRSPPIQTRSCHLA